MITAVLIKYKRLRELEQIIDHLETIPQIDEILVRDNSEENLGDYGRYLEAMKSKNDTLYFQDDDCIVNNIQQLIKLYNGTRLVCNMTEAHQQLYKDKEQMLGWGSLLDKSWFKYLDIYTKIYPMDDIFYRQADRILTSLLPKKPLVVTADITEFPSSWEPMAMHKQPDFYLNKKIIQDRMKELCLAS